jgi:hypothetical protein
MLTAVNTALLGVQAKTAKSQTEVSRSRGIVAEQARLRFEFPARSTNVRKVSHSVSSTFCVEGQQPLHCRHRLSTSNGSTGSVNGQPRDVTERLLRALLPTLDSWTSAGPVVGARLSRSPDGRTALPLA